MLKIIIRKWLNGVVTITYYNNFTSLFKPVLHQSCPLTPIKPDDGKPMTN